MTLPSLGDVRGRLDSDRGRLLVGKRTALRRDAARAFMLLVAALIGASFLSGPAIALDASPGVTPQIKAGYEKVANEVLCYCGCARQTVQECSCSIAFDLRADWERRIAAGESPDAIVAKYITEHGEQARNAPPRKGLNLLAWFGPGIAIIVAAAATFLTLAVWAARGKRLAGAAAARAGGSPDEGADGGQGSGAKNAAVRERLERELEEFES